MNNDGNAKGRRAGRPERMPRCGLCKNHMPENKIPFLKGHKRFCPYIDHDCRRCDAVRARREKMRDQIARKRLEKTIAANENLKKNNESPPRLPSVPPSSSSNGTVVLNNIDSNHVSPLETAPPVSSSLSYVEWPSIPQTATPSNDEDSQQERQNLINGNIEEEQKKQVTDKIIGNATIEESRLLPVNPSIGSIISYEDLYYERSNLINEMYRRLWHDTVCLRNFFNFKSRESLALVYTIRGLSTSFSSAHEKINNGVSYWDGHMTPVFITMEQLSTILASLVFLNWLWVPTVPPQ